MQLREGLFLILLLFLVSASILGGPGYEIPFCQIYTLRSGIWITFAGTLIHCARSFSLTEQGWQVSYHMQLMRRTHSYFFHRRGSLDERAQSTTPRRAVHSACGDTSRKGWRHILTSYLHVAIYVAKTDGCKAAFD